MCSSKINPSPPKHWFLCVVDALELCDINLFPLGDVRLVKFSTEVYCCSDVTLSL